METNTETKLSLKEKLYQETLNEFARRQWNPETQKNDFRGWKELIEVYPKKNRGWLIYQADIEKAVKLAIKKTYDALQDGQLTEVGQTLFDRRKDIEAHTANRIFAELDLRLITKLHKVSDLKKDNPDTIWCIKEKDYNAIKKQHGVKVY